MVVKRKNLYKIIFLLFLLCLFLISKVANAEQLTKDDTTITYNEFSFGDISSHNNLIYSDLSDSISVSSYNTLINNQNNLSSYSYTTSSKYYIGNTEVNSNSYYLDNVNFSKGYNTLNIYNGKYTLGTGLYYFDITINALGNIVLTGTNGSNLDYNNSDYIFPYSGQYFYSGATSTPYIPSEVNSPSYANRVFCGNNGCISKISGLIYIKGTNSLNARWFHIPISLWKGDLSTKMSISQPINIIGINIQRLGATDLSSYTLPNSFISDTQFNNINGGSVIEDANDIKINDDSKVIFNYTEDMNKVNPNFMTDLILMPINILNKFITLLNSNTCTTPTFTLPYVNKEYSLICGNDLYQRLNATTFITWVGFICGGLVWLKYILYFCKTIDSATALDFETIYKGSWGDL